MIDHRRLLSIAAIACLAVTAPAVAQVSTPSPGMRVQGPRAADPRLRNHQSRVSPSEGNAAIAETTSDEAGSPLKRPSYLKPQDGSAGASGPSAIDLMKQCFDGSDDGTIQNPTCVGYIAGAIGAMRVAASVFPEFPICLPDRGIPNEEVVGDVSSYLEGNPDSLQKSARSVVFLVLSQKHPCKGTRP